jgi:arsenate reductase-like glutaredoxin family protein
LAGLGGIKMHDLLNERSKTYKDMKINAKDLSENEVAELLSANPKAMFRPLLTDGKKLVVGFQLEQMEAVL